jgi:hypothetical protein
MDQSSAAKTLLEVAASAGPRTRWPSYALALVRAGPRTRFQSRTRDSSLSTAPPSPAKPTTYRGKRRHVRFDIEVEAGPSNASTTIPTRSTCGKAPIRLVDQQTPPEAIPRRVTTKHYPSTQPPQPPQPPLKGISAGRKPLSNATNTLGKKRTSSTSQKTKIQALASKSRPAKPSTKSALTTRRSTITSKKVTKPQKVTQKAKQTLATKKVSSNSTAIASSTANATTLAPVPFKL